MGSYVPPWAQTAAMACAPGGVASGIVSLEEYRGLVQSNPHAMATADVVARPVVARPGPVDPDAPAGRDKAGVRLAQWPVMIPTSVRRTLGSTATPRSSGVRAAGAPVPAGQSGVGLSGAAEPPPPPPKFGEAGWSREAAQLEFAGPVSRDGHRLRLERGVRPAGSVVARVVTECARVLCEAAGLLSMFARFRVPAACSRTCVRECVGVGFRVPAGGTGPPLARLQRSSSCWTAFTTSETRRAWHSTPSA